MFENTLAIIVAEYDKYAQHTQNPVSLFSYMCGRR